MALDFKSFILSLFCIVTFASFNKQFVVASHNLHGFKKSSTFHKQCLSNFGGVWMGQETWLPESRLSQLQELGVQFVASSGMEETVSSGIMRGRPYGGVSIAWSPDLNHVIRPLVNYRHKRVVCIEVTTDPQPLLLLSVYMPFFDASKRNECLSETIDTLSMIEEIVSDHPLHKLIIGGDINTELKGSSLFDSFWSEFMRKHDMVCCDNLVKNDVNYTYIHDSLDQKKWNDHFFLSSSLVASTEDHMILDAGDNVSDHLPIMFKISCKTMADPPQSEIRTKPPSLKWEKCSDEQKIVTQIMLLCFHRNIRPA